MYTEASDFNEEVAGNPQRISRNVRINLSQVINAIGVDYVPASQDCAKRTGCTFKMAGTSPLDEL
jgi:hypothetical protein